MYRLENEHLAITVSNHGAELQSLISGGREYLWQGDARYWKRRAPILFPIVGKLKNGEYRYRGHSYTLPQHGFARDRDFSLLDHDEHHISFRLEDDGESAEHYPFAFTLDLSYTLLGDTLRVGWQVHNPAEQEDLLFSIGGHPAFALPLTDGETFADHHIQIESANFSRLGWRDGLLDPTPHPGERHLALDYAAFANDALIYHTPAATTIRLHGTRPTPALNISYPDLPYLGIWTSADKEAPFICIEPWAGVMDCADYDGELEHKLGIIRLAPQSNWQRHYDIQIQHVDTP